MWNPYNHFAVQINVSSTLPSGADEVVDGV